MASAPGERGQEPWLVGRGAEEAGHEDPRWRLMAQVLSARKGRLEEGKEGSKREVTT